MTGPSAEPGTWAAQQLDRAERALEQTVGGRARQKVIFMLAAILAVQAADLGSTGAVAANLQDAFQIGNSQIGLLVTATLLMGAVATLPAGILMDRLNRTHVLAASVLFWSAAAIGVGASTSYRMLLLMRVAMGAVTATALPGCRRTLKSGSPASLVKRPLPVGAVRA